MKIPSSFVCLRALFVMGLLVGPCTPARGEERFALLVGANMGWADDQPLRDAEQDAEHLREVLVELGGFAPDRAVVLRDPDTATLRASLRALSERLRGLGEPALVFLYFVGLQDGRGLHLRGAPLSWEELKDALGALPVETRLGVMELCDAGAPGASAARPASRMVDEWEARRLGLLVVQGKGGACRGREGPAGMTFARHLVSGLRGMAASKGEARVRLSEAAGYAWRRTWQEEGSVLAWPGWAGEPFLTQPGEGVAWLVLRGGERHVVLDERDARQVADVHAEPNGPGVLALPPGRYQLLRVSGARIEWASVSLGPGARVDAAEVVYEVSPTGCMPRCGSQGLQGEALREWRRGEALGLLVAGEPGNALLLFEELLEEQPGDEASRRGKVRALVWLADASARLQEEQHEYEALRLALELEPSLVEDRDFTGRYRRYWDLKAVEQRSERLEQMRTEGNDVSPYSRLKWGVGVEAFGSRGLLAPVGLWVLNPQTQLHVALDALGGQAIDVGARYIQSLLPLPERPYGVYMGLGMHVPLLGEPMLASVWKLNGPDVPSFFRRNLHVDLGVQLSLWDEVALEVGITGQLRLDGSAPVSMEALKSSVMLTVGAVHFLH